MSLGSQVRLQSTQMVGVRKIGRGDEEFPHALGVVLLIADSVLHETNILDSRGTLTEHRGPQKQAQGRQLYRRVQTW